MLIGASIGIALAPQDGKDPDLLLKNADMALYRAKAEGRGKFLFFQKEMDARLQERRYLELDQSSEWARLARRGIQFVDLQLRKSAG